MIEDEVDLESKVWVAVGKPTDKVIIIRCEDNPDLWEIHYGGGMDLVTLDGKLIKRIKAEPV